MARPSLARRLAVASVLTTLVLTAAACGGDDDTTATDTGSETSGETDGTETTTDSEESEEASGDLQELSAEEFYPAIMAALQEAETMAFTVTTTGGPMATELSGEMRYSDDGIDMSAATTSGEPLDMVLLDKTMYISGGGLPLPDGKTWLKVDLSDPDSLFGQLGRSTDPSLMFKAMETPQEFELLGTEDVDGVETNHYNVVMDTTKYAEAMDMPAEMSGFMPEEIAIEMWVDADDQPRKFRQELQLPDPTGGGKTTTTTTTEGTYSDFGGDVEIEAPPASDVADNVPGMG